MGFVQGDVLFRMHEGRLQTSRDQGATWRETTYSGWQVVERKVIPADVQSYDFTGLDGDLDEAYQFSAEVIGGVGSAGGLLSLRPNGLTTNQEASGIGSDDGGTPFGDNRTEMALGYVPIAGRRASSYGTFYAKAGSDRTLVVNAALVAVGANTVRSTNFSSAWTDTSTKITFLRVFSAAATGLGAGTILTLFKRVIPG